MRITLVLLGLSLRDKLCLFLHFLLYLIDIKEKERTFLFYEKNVCRFKGRGTLRGEGGGGAMYGGQTDT